jgi:hypothetical protein
VRCRQWNIPRDGFYVGAHAGVSTGYSTRSATQSDGAPNLRGSLNLLGPFDLFTETGSHFAGLTAGYNYMVPSRIVLGGEADVSFASTLSAGPAITWIWRRRLSGWPPERSSQRLMASVGYGMQHMLHIVIDMRGLQSRKQL